MCYISLVSAGGDQFVVFLVFAVIAVVVNVIKKLAGPQEDGGTTAVGGASSYAAPEDELQKFLQSITGAQARPAPAPPPAPAQPAVPPPLPRSTAAQPARQRQTSRGIRGLSTAQTATQGISGRRVGHGHSVRNEETRVSRAIPAMGWNRTTLQQAIIMKEILGPPVALRSTAGPQQPGSR
jgi:hypothetical protein